MKKTNKSTKTFKQRKTVRSGLYEVLLFNPAIDMYDSVVVAANSEAMAMSKAEKIAQKGFSPSEARAMRNKKDLYYYNEGACYVRVD